ncbi:exported hypothetical protein [Desulfamplus magnetovallimortis]|uniref:Uncharacterized protein n=1 Tax=Desulfamplus magnetovallimortis TaxID=1246637 RepID=A0A1W1HDC1_9BACT|nr:C13 family peptidase [Desulfamplus magnetovallimortis]SLM30436.1 exported hypothetical protein [Desulfamplus magnetovallimortis]
MFFYNINRHGRSPATPDHGNNVSISTVKKTILFFIFFVICAVTTYSHAVENKFDVDVSLYPFSGPSTIVSLDDGLSQAVINRVSGKISRIKHDQVVFERTIDNFKPFDLLAVNDDLYVTCSECGEVKVLSQIDFSLKKTIPVNQTATYMTLSSDRSKIYVSSPLKSADTISMIDIASRSLISPPIYDPDLNIVEKLVTRNGKLFATSRISSSINIYDENTLMNLNIPTPTWGFVPDDIVVTDNYIYLSSIEEMKISVIDLETFEKIKDIEFNGSPGRMIFDGDHYIYVLNSNRTGKVFRLDTDTNEFDDNSCFQSGNCFYTGSDPEDAVISRDGKVLYVSNYSDNAISYHFISGKLFIEPRDVIVKPSDDNAGDTGVSGTTGEESSNIVTLKAGGGSGNYLWSVNGGTLSATSGDEVSFTPPSDEDIYKVTVQDLDSLATATSEIIVVDIRVTPETLTVSDQNPLPFNITGGTPPYTVSILQGGTIEHFAGESDFTFSPPLKDGIYTIEVMDRNGAKKYANVVMASEGVTVLPADASRAAIIVAGGPSDTHINGIWPELELAASEIYRILYEEKGFTKEQLYLLSPVDLDIDGDGIEDQGTIRNEHGVFLDESYIGDAFQWAENAKELDQPLLVFLMGHGSYDKYYLNVKKPENSIDAETLDQYLDDYQQSTGNKVVVIMDSCHSGSFIDDLAGENRAIITSTGEENIAFYITHSDNKNTVHSFISYFSTWIRKGVNLKECYERACVDLENFYAEESCSSIYDTQTYFSQNPQYEDEGDGDYYDLLMDQESDDGVMLKNIYIKRPSPYANSSRKQHSILSESRSLKGDTLESISDMTMSIVSMNGNSIGSLSAAEPVNLKAKVGIAQSNIEAVYAILKPPGMKMTATRDENDIIHLSYPQIRLARTEEDRNLESPDSEIWETLWNGAVYKGCYEINFYARSQNGTIAFSDAITLSVYDDDAPEPPEAPDIELFLGKNGNDISGEDSTSKTFSKSDHLTINFMERLNWGYDLYLAIFLPDGRIWTFNGAFDGIDSSKISNVTYDPASIVKWKAERIQDNKLTLLDMDLSQGIMPSGQYLVCALMVPQGKDLFDMAPYWVFSEQLFSIND